MTAADNVTTAYVRTQGFPGGVLVDVSWQARRCGLTRPVALTLQVWAELVAGRESLAGCGLSDRLRPVLRGLGLAVIGQIADGLPGRPQSYRYKASMWRRDLQQFVPVLLRAVNALSSDGRLYLAVTMFAE